MELTASHESVFPMEVLSRYQIHETRNAATILRATNPALFEELVIALNEFEVVSDDLLLAGGQESGLTRLARSSRGH